jgi:hypothetical protein
MKVLKGFTAAIIFGIGLTVGEVFGAPASDGTQTVAGGGVTVKATFLNPKGADDPRFQVVLDTHSVNLDSYDLKSITVLREDTGKIHVPTTIKSQGSGHHRNTVITFAKLSAGVKRIELIIKDIAGVQERSFSWKLK